ncbi:hypothetical protein NDU88_006244 [Pleurodeles waltl]|uniref:Uncharacterized protein n=1 Tax=Pleurodeles waltl TaxID=8319 RepID=A0AAV7X080_PLEWA|nr:hypothetical protein NDU88_006244 [Pleurodeles waltl]
MYVTRLGQQNMYGNAARMAEHSVFFSFNRRPCPCRLFSQLRRCYLQRSAEKTHLLVGAAQLRPDAPASSAFSAL